MEAQTPQDRATWISFSWPDPRWIATLILGGLILGVFGGSRDYALLNYDSEVYILQDRAIRALEWERIDYIFHSYYFVNYNPFQRLSYMIDYAMWGVDPGGYRSTNFLLHWLASGFLFLFVYELTKNQWVSWLTTLAFAIHPTRVECVVWLAQRKDVLAAAFGFGALWMYRRSWSEVSHQPVHSLEETSWGNQPSKFIKRHLAPGLWYLGSVLAATGALASKAQWVPVWMLLILLDFCEHRPLTRWGWWRYLPFFGVCALFGWYAIDSQLVKGGFARSPSVFEYCASPVADIATHLWYSIWPVNLCIRIPRVTPEMKFVVGGLIFLLLSGIAGWKSWKGNRLCLLGLGWFFLFLAPMLNLLPGVLEPSNRYLYVSLPGLVLAAATAFSSVPARLSWGLCIGLALIWSGLTVQYLPAWKDDYALWTYTIQKVPQDNLAWAELIRAQTIRGEYAEAQRSFEIALRQANTTPVFPLLYQSAAELAQKTGRDPFIPINQGLALAPQSTQLLTTAGQYAFEKKNYPQAEHYLTTSFSVGRTLEAALLLAQLYEATNQPEKGVPLMIAALTHAPYREDMALMLGRLYEKQHRLSEAEAAYRLSVQNDPSLPEPYFRLSKLAFQQNRLDEASELVLKMQTRLGGKQLPPEALLLLADIRNQQGRPAEAAGALIEAQQQTRPPAGENESVP